MNPNIPPPPAQLGATFGELELAGTTSEAVTGIQALTGAQIAGLLIGGVVVIAGLRWVGKKLSSNSSLSLAG